MLKQSLVQKQKLNMSQSLRMAIELQKKSIEDLVDFINDEALENVFVDFVDRDSTINIPKRKFIYGNSKSDTIEATVGDRLSLDDMLINQLGELRLGKKQYYCGLYIIYSLDDDGFFKEDIGKISADLSIDIEEVEYVLKLIQAFQPTGIASIDYIDCLLRQSDDILMSSIIKDHLLDVARGDVDKIAEALAISEGEVDVLISKLKKLSPKPDISSSYSEPEYIYPDILVEIDNGNIHIEIINDLEVRVDETYKSMIKEAKGCDKEYLRKQFYRAKYIIKAVETRRDNILKISKGIVNSQADFFLNGGDLVPLNMETLARICSISQSTVSRITSNKYLEFDNNIYSLKEFFPKAIRFNESSITPNRVKYLIENLINEEDKNKPLTDEKIACSLWALGVDIKRRTVAKYRMEMGIASKYKRRIYRGNT